MSNPDDSTEAPVKPEDMEFLGDESGEPITDESGNKILVDKPDHPTV